MTLEELKRLHEFLGNDPIRVTALRSANSDNAELRFCKEVKGKMFYFLLEVPMDTKR